MKELYDHQIMKVKTIAYKIMTVKTILFFIYNNQD